VSFDARMRRGAAKMIRGEYIGDLIRGWYVAWGIALCDSISTVQHKCSTPTKNWIYFRGFARSPTGPYKPRTETPAGNLPNRYSAL